MANVSVGEDARVESEEEAEAEVRAAKGAALVLEVTV